MNRDIKFRACDGEKIIYPDEKGWFNNVKYPNYQTPQHIRLSSAIEHLTVMQYTGLKDKNGKEIYEGDLLRVKGVMGDKGEYSYDCIYRVNELNYKGLSLLFVKLFSETPDSTQNSFPIVSSPKFEYGSLCVDYRNQNYDHLAFDETSGENHLSGKRWKENHFTNDVEVIGNIYENPELLK